jgi:hypothetical protein
MNSMSYKHSAISRQLTLSVDRNLLKTKDYEFLANEVTELE